MVADIPYTASNHPCTPHDLDLFDSATGEVMLDTYKETDIASPHIYSNVVVLFMHGTKFG